MKDDFLFVYGTLRKAASPKASELLTQHCEFHSGGWVQGKLFQVAGYPGLVDSNCASDRVVGELYQIGGRLSILPELDYYEECTDHFPQPHEYIRRRRPVLLVEHGIVEAWIYLYNRDVTQLQLIPSGDYSAFIAASGEL